MTELTQTENEGAREGLFHTLQKPIPRGAFLKYAGVSVATATLLLAGCKKNDNPGPAAPGTVDLGTGDIGVLNYAYALEQLEAAFYIQAYATPYSGITTAELAILKDLRDHETIHRDFFKAAIGASAIGALSFNFSSIDFTSRASVLGTAKALEDTGVSAYNGAGKLLVDPDYLLLAGKIVSVEARHASAIRDLLNPLSADFAGDDVVNATTGLDVAAAPSAVLPIAGVYIRNTITFAGLPS